MTSNLPPVFVERGKRVLVTGASRGLGRAIAKAYGQCGCRVALTYASRKEDAEAAVEEVRSAGAEDVQLFQCDVGNETQVKAMAEGVLAAWQGLDVLVNNAGMNQDALFLRLRTEDWDRILDVNLRGAMFCSREFVKPMMKARDGVILMISSVVGQMGNAGQAAYAASKAGLIGLTKSLAREFASRQIRVNAVCPGYFGTEMTAVMKEDAKKALEEMIPLGRMGEATELAGLCIYLSSPAGRYITGQALAINGGLYI